MWKNASNSFVATASIQISGRLGYVSEKTGIEHYISIINTEPLIFITDNVQPSRPRKHRRKQFSSFSEVISQMIGRSIRAGLVSEHNAIAMLEEMIRMMKRGALDNDIEKA
jgi:hypothetical protein